MTVDVAARLVTVGGGCRLGDMDRACQPYGLACVTGTNPDTGVVGLSTHGGAGYLSRMHGLAVDNFVSAELVTAAGEVRSTHSHRSPLSFSPSPIAPLTSFEESSAINK